jgi:hypothetical protein
MPVMRHLSQFGFRLRTYLREEAETMSGAPQFTTTGEELMTEANRSKGASAATRRRLLKHVVPFGPAVVEFPYSRLLARGAVARLKNGMLPDDVEDMWFVVMRGGNLDFYIDMGSRLDSYRGWRGRLAYRVKVVQAAAGVVLGPLSADVAGRWPDAIPCFAKWAMREVDLLITEIDEDRELCLTLDRREPRVSGRGWGASAPPLDRRGLATSSGPIGAAGSRGRWRSLR